MYTANDVIERPLDVVQQCMEAHADKANWNVSEVFERALDGQMDKIPSLLSQRFEDVKENTLVHFRGMVQDSSDPEYYQKCVMRRGPDGSTSKVATKYVDALPACPEGFSFEFQSGNNDIDQRIPLYVVAVPGQAEWAADAVRSGGGDRDGQKGGVREEGEEGDAVRNSKRERSEEGAVPALAPSSTAHCDEVDGQGGKKARVDEAKVASRHGEVYDSKRAEALAQIQKGKACIVKIYSDSESGWKLNGVCDFFGVVSFDVVDPSTSDAHVEEDVGLAPRMEPPASIVPRLHCIAWKEVNTLYPIRYTTPIDQSHLAVARENALSCMKAITGDSLAAEYLLMCLISRVTERLASLTLGKLALNFSGLHRNFNHAGFISLLSHFVPNMKVINLSVKYLNESAFVPKKDYDIQRLLHGELQLPAGTVIVVNELTMDEGVLQESGIRNLGHLKKLMQSQSLDYDFQYYSAPFETDCPVIILSEGQSMIGSDARVAVGGNSNFGCAEGVSEEMVQGARHYLCACRSTSALLEEAAMAHVEESIVQLRQSAEGATELQLHYLMGLARLQAITWGRQGVEKADWDRALALDRERHLKMAQ
uniref:Mini-chromosome maintenance complex-binding protein n=1 Tax=Palpitomonas bilix TaxID=652834 RepID=A0A7S3GLC7_9EUKA|mmetsp:Transcript_8133/g.21526  ORF Transcript_8133/g.21526 Transcript_8133/m.21526 type:complete len:594 (+) Transcript_8133:30-1811(+)